MQQPGKLCAAGKGHAHAQQRLTVGSNHEVGCIRFQQKIRQHHGERHPWCDVTVGNQNGACAYDQLQNAPTYKQNYKLPCHQPDSKFVA